jgi:predicted NUDIX family NTP pyrophosphohydrolase
MSSTAQSTTGNKDIFAVYQQNVDKYFNGVKQSVPRYHQSVTNVQQEYLDAVENVINSTIALQKDFATKAGITTNVPSASLKIIRDTTEEVVKAYDVQNKVAIAAIDSAQQNIKTFNENAKAFAELNKNIAQSWISTFTQKTN